VLFDRDDPRGRAPAARPSAQDRVLALDFLYVNGMLVMLTLGIFFASGMYFVAALLIALFGFVSSAALAKFLLRGEVVE
jgi:multicomponent K+:H+ antiporter subunit F